MTRYFMGQGDVPMTESDAIREFDNAEDAFASAEEFKKEIFSGVYDEEWGIEEEAERSEWAEAVFVFAIEYTKSGSIRKTYKL